MNDVAEKVDLRENLDVFLCNKIVLERLKYDSTQEFFQEHFSTEKIKREFENQILDNQKYQQKIRKIDSFNQINEYFQSIKMLTNESSASSLSTSLVSTSNSNKAKESCVPNLNNSTKTRVNYLKQKRAKRGQYRKYESDQLERAVEVVLSGLMSVHKAGLCFGVPHSTLEYKVKEKTVLNENFLNNKLNYNEANYDNPNSVAPNSIQFHSSLAKTWPNNQINNFFTLFDK
jgi:hypothetical protein